MFKHQESPKCKFDKHCNVKLCAYKHLVDGSSNNDDKSLESKEKEPYENLEEYQKDEIREQICQKNCW